MVLISGNHLLLWLFHLDIAVDQTYNTLNRLFDHFNVKVFLVFINELHPDDFSLSKNDALNYLFSNHQYGHHDANVVFPNDIFNDSWS